ncbi:hypothetical protein CEXT_554481 [Caerostris extrusa]|uniref:Secreted protein n=1 Tax=Caerostris extrusa TaxID=172846 RepID=A0AAV4NID2_CAEEX|nr:hypothetical protein CEXT_554481 [Caerostris extrusa]
MDCSTSPCWLNSWLVVLLLCVGLVEGLNLGVGERVQATHRLPLPGVASAQGVRRDRGGGVGAPFRTRRNGNLRRTTAEER